MSDHIEIVIDHACCSDGEIRVLRNGEVVFKRLEYEVMFPTDLRQFLAVCGVDPQQEIDIREIQWDDD